MKRKSVTEMYHHTIWDYFILWSLFKFITEVDKLKISWLNLPKSAISDVALWYVFFIT